MKITVKFEYIKNWDCNDSLEIEEKLSYCPIAEVLKDKGYKHVWVSKKGAQVGDKLYQSEAIRDFVNKVDSGHKFFFEDVEIDLGEPKPVEKAGWIANCGICGQFTSLHNNIKSLGDYHFQLNTKELYEWSCGECSANILAESYDSELR